MLNDAALGIAALNAEQPLPAPDHADSVQPRVVPAASAGSSNASTIAIVRPAPGPQTYPTRN